MPKMTCTLNKSHAANELVESVRARDTKRVDAALHQFECEQDPGPLKNAIKAAMALRGPKEERVEAILKKLAREAGEWQDRMNDCCIFEDVYEEAALSGTPPDRLIVFMSDAGYAADAGYYVNLLCLKNFGHVYAIELFSFLAQRSGCLKLANMSPDPNDPCYDDVTMMQSTMSTPSKTAAQGSVCTRVQANFWPNSNVRRLSLSPR